MNVLFKRLFWPAAALVAWTPAALQAGSFSVRFDQSIDSCTSFREAQSQAPAAPQAVPAPNTGASPASSDDFGLSFDQGFPDVLRAQILGDLAFLEGREGTNATPLHQQIFGFGPLNGPAYLQFFESRIKHVSLYSTASPNVLASVNQDLFPNTIRLTQNYSVLQIPQIDRISAIFHESRHVDGYPHVLCPTPFKTADGSDVKGLFSHTLMAGQPACDDAALGAYGLQAILLKNIANYCSNCSALVRQQAAIYGDDCLQRIIGPAAHQTLVNDLNQP